MIHSTFMRSALKTAFKSIVFVFAMSTLFCAPSTQAATLFFGSQSKEVGVGKRFEVGVFVNTQNEPVNAIEGTLTYPSNALRVVNIEDGGSLLSLWVTRPSTKNPLGTIPFSGVMPGGYEGTGGYLFSVIFEALKPGPFTLSTTNERILLNDAEGTTTKVNRAPLTLNATEKAKEVLAPEILPPTDITPPSPFTPTLHQDENAFEGKWFVVFSAADGESGIDHYELQEKTDGAPDPTQWKTVVAPAVLNDQTLNSFIYIKAVDRAGNERIAVMLPSQLGKGYEKFVIWGIIGILGAGVVVFIWSKLCRKKTEV